MVVGNLELREKLRFGRFKPELLEPCELGCNSLRAGERHLLFIRSAERSAELYSFCDLARKYEDPRGATRQS